MHYLPHFVWLPGSRIQRPNGVLPGVRVPPVCCVPIPGRPRQPDVSWALHFRHSTSRRHPRRHLGGRTSPSSGKWKLLYILFFVRFPVQSVVGVLSTFIASAFWCFHKHTLVLQMFFSSF